MANLKGNEASLVKFKPKWRSGKTQTIRVPIAIANLVLEDAREIDANGNQSLLEINKTQKEQIEQLKNKLSKLQQELIQNNALATNHNNQVNNTDTSDRERLKTLLSEAVSGKTKYVTDVKKKIAEIGKVLNFDIHKEGKTWSVNDCEHQDEMIM